MSGDQAPTLGREQLLAIYRQAREEFPNECCGYIIGWGDDAEVVRCVNVMDKYHRVDPETYPRTAATAYMLDYKDIRRLDESLDGDRPATIVYHSHPRHGAYFSEEDSRAALGVPWPVDYLVVDVQDDEVVESLLFRRTDDDRFEQIARFDGAPV